MNRLRLRLLIGLVAAVALAWGATLDLNAAAKAAARATARAVATATAAKSTVTTPTPAPVPQKKKATGTGCVINGRTVDPCPPGVLKQVKRQAARQIAAPQKTGVAVRFAGINSATATMSPLAQVGTGPTALAAPAAVVAPVDYFGVANWANSPLPAVSATGTLSGGLRKFVDTLPGLCAVSGPTALQQCIPVAQANITTFPGSDYYQIGLSEYTKKMHSDLPGTGTNLRGYDDLTSPNHQYLGPLILAIRNRPTRVLFTNQLLTDLKIPVDTTYMGAGAINDGNHSVQLSSQKRATLHLHGGNTPWISDGTTHQWTTPAGGDGQPLFPGFAKGFSAQNVPDMVPPGCTGAQCVNLTPGPGDGQLTFYWTNQQSGRLMFFHDHAYGITRLNVYAGEAAGYLLADPGQESALKAAGAPGTIAVKADTTLGAPAGSVVPDLTASDLAHVLPLVIQDKTFVPDSGAGGQMAAQDPTWDFTNWGGPGDLWFPHVYSPNQNPADVTGANGFGRYDWGPWFWPPQNTSTLVLPAYACTSIATPTTGWAFPPLQCPGVPDPTRPAPSNAPSSTPEGFMDTPVVNGTAYPTVTVDPTGYRFQMLNAANDRALNLGLYIADPLTISVSVGGSGYAVPPAAPPAVTVSGCTAASATAVVDGTGAVSAITVAAGASGCINPSVAIAAPPTGGTQAYAVASVNTDVRMVPAIPASAGRGLPNCAQMLPMAGGGQITTPLLDGSGHPVNGTGLPAGCWPLYSSAQGYTAGSFGENGGTLSWGNSDARAGGLPDPLTAGPPFIQIGAEGGVLPQLAVIPSTPVSYDYNKRSITVLNVLNHGLWLGPAERADVIVDFSAFAGQTLILYNDSPAPVPAGDPRLDYYTNDPDFSTSGGAPTTMAGYGPNMRTIMQIKVNGACSAGATCAAVNITNLQNALPTIFTNTQDAVIVPEVVYPSGNGGAAKDTYVRIQDTTVQAWIGGGVGSLSLSSGGAGYTAPPSVAIAAPGCASPCATATAIASLAPTSVGGLTLTNGGSGYTSTPTVTINGNGTGATATARLATTSVASATVTKQGSGYSSVPTVTFSAPPAGGTTATGTAVVSSRRVVSITITNPGSGYVIGAAPTVTITGGGGSGATATATLRPTAVASLTLTNGGGGYTSASVSVSNGGGTGAAATATITPTVVSALTLTSPGSGYTAAPAVTISAPQTAGTTATALANAPLTDLQPKTIQELFTLDYGRMNATLGVEIPKTNFQTQTTIPYGYADPPTEIFKDGETQLWKITHNGVDTHFIHFHLFTVQVINRVGWDGAIKPPDPYELGLKDTVRMNPLEDIIVALRPFKQSVPFAVPTSWRPMNVTAPVGTASNIDYTNVDPTGQPANVINARINFGWEYVWHCHILGHEENDMMRAMILAVAPPVPTVTAVTGGSKGTTTLTISDAIQQIGYADATGFTIQRATAAGGPWTTVGSVAATGAPVTFTDTGLTSRATYYYQVVANNMVGYTQVYAAPAVGYPHPSADSAPSTVASAVAR